MLSDETAAALRTLALALICDEDDVRALRPYGNLPEHVADALADLDHDVKLMNDTDGAY